MGELPGRRKRHVELKPGASLQALPRFEQGPGPLKDAREALDTGKAVAEAPQQPAQSAHVARTAPRIEKPEKPPQGDAVSDPLVTATIRVGLSAENEKLLGDVLLKWGGSRAGLLATIARSTAVADADFRAAGVVVTRRQSRGGDYRSRFSIERGLYDKWRGLIDPSNSLQPGEVASLAADVAFNRTATDILNKMLKE